MPISTASLVIGISSRALFDLDEENRIYETEGLQAYAQYQLAHEDDVLRPGTGFPLTQSILHLNTPEHRWAEVVIMSRNGADTSLRIFNSVQHYGLDISRAALAGGASLVPYLRAFNVDLFLSAHAGDVQEAIDGGFAAGRIYGLPGEFSAPPDQLRIAFDGDAVLFSNESERLFEEGGLEGFRRHEEAFARIPLEEGPFAPFIRELARLQSEYTHDASPIRTALVTARGGTSQERVIRTLRAWGVRVDEAFFLDGLPKDEVLKAFRPHIFFDDQEANLKTVSEFVPSIQVPIPTRETLRPTPPPE